MCIPQIIIVSTQRSGTHLLESFLKKHPIVHGRGEFILRYKRTGEIDNNTRGKINVGIVMYSEFTTLLKMARDFDNGIDIKLIHLLRNPIDVAYSRLQMEADKNLLGKDYKAHIHKEDLQNSYPELSTLRNQIDISKLNSLTIEVTSLQDQYKELLLGIPHLELFYEEFVPNNINVEVLDSDVQKKILAFLGLENNNILLYTTYIKTGTAPSTNL